MHGYLMQWGKLRTHWVLGPLALSSNHPKYGLGSVISIRTHAVGFGSYGLLSNSAAKFSTRTIAVLSAYTCSGCGTCETAENCDINRTPDRKPPCTGVPLTHPAQLLRTMLCQRLYQRVRHHAVGLGTTSYESAADRTRSTKSAPQLGIKLGISHLEDCKLLKMQQFWRRRRKPLPKSYPLKDG